MTAFSFYTASIKNELIKLKRTFAFWLTIISALLFPLLFFIAYFLKHKTLAPEIGINPWEKFMTTQIENSIPFFIPMFIVLITSLIMQIEHKSLGIKHLFTLPIPKWSVYFGKLSIVIFAIITTYIYYYIAILLSGALLGFIYSDLAFLNFQPEHVKYIKILSTSLVASLGIVGVQFWLSFRFKNFIVPLGIGMFLAIIGIIISQAPQSIYFPYTFSVLSVSLGDEIPLTFGVSSVTVFSVICFLVTSIFGYLNIKKLNKNSITTTRLVTILCVFMLFSCKKAEEDKTFKIYHLKPNRVYIATDTVEVYGWFSKRRNDFFTIKNYDIHNEQHKIKIDSFVVNYLKKEDFLTKNKNVNWSLTFFKYGNGIDESTAHQYGTDYTIHNLFSYKKEIASVYFDTRTGYEVSNYNITPEKFNQTKRKIISDYFATLNLNLEKIEGFSQHLTAVSKKNDTIKLLGKFISKEDWDAFYVAQFIVEKVLKGSIHNDTIKVSYKFDDSFQNSSEKVILKLIENDIVLGNGPKYYVIEDSSKKRNERHK